MNYKDLFEKHNCDSTEKLILDINFINEKDKIFEYRKLKDKYKPDDDQSKNDFKQLNYFFFMK